MEWFTFVLCLGCCTKWLCVRLENVIPPQHIRVFGLHSSRSTKTKGLALTGFLKYHPFFYSRSSRSEPPISFSCRLAADPRWCDFYTSPLYPWFSFCGCGGKEKKMPCVSQDVRERAQTSVLETILLFFLFFGRKNIGKKERLVRRGYKKI